MSSIKDWSQTPGSNNSATPVGAPEGMTPGSANNVMREMMASTRTAFDELPYVVQPDTPTRVDNDTFTVTTDLTARYTVGRRIKFVGATTGYGTITASAFAAVTTVDVTMDSGNIPTSLVTVSLGSDPSIGLPAYYIQTPAESAAGVTPVNLYQYYGALLRDQNNTVPGTTDVNVGLQAVIDSLSLEVSALTWGNLAATSKPLLIRTTTQQNATFRGSARVNAALLPTAIDIKQAAQNINCLIFNQNNNGHLHLESFQFFSTVAYTGVGIYCVEGGGADASGQCLFSAIFRDIWFGMSNTNNGFLDGGMQNCVVYEFTAEGCKNAVFRLRGTGCADNFYRDISMVSCFDSAFLQKDDTNGSLLVTVDGLHVYQHQRGPVFDVQNWVECNINDVTLEVDPANLGTTGLFKFNNCTGLIVSNFKTLTRTGTVACAIGIEINGTSQIKFSQGQVIADIGCQLDGTGAMELDFDGIDFTLCTSDSFKINGAISGTIRSRNCKFNNATISSFVSQVGSSVNWYSYSDEFLNAGLGGNAASRNIDITTSGEVVLYNPVIGQNNGNAAAAYYIQAGGSGTVTLVNPTFVGTPPTGLTTGAQTVNIIYKSGDGGVVASAAALPIPNFGDVFSVSGTTNITNIGTATNNGRKITLIFQGALTVTDGSNLALAGNFVTTADDTITLQCRGSTWYEISRSVN